MNEQVLGAEFLEGEPRITAYCINPELAMPIVTASQARNWMDATEARFAYRCLPLLIANQSGWLLLNNQKLSISWSGGDDSDSLRVEALEGERPELTSSHFGHGVVTWDVPYLFRTSPGYNLLVRGPSNWPKDGIYPLEGIVETDWLGATFSVNWKMTRPDHTVIFEVGEPIAMLVPQRRGELESFRPAVVDIERDEGVNRDYELWEARRLDFLRRLKEGDPQAAEQGWEKHYFQGTKLTGEVIDDHRTKLKLRKFHDLRVKSE